MKLISALFLISAVPSVAFVAPTRKSAGKILTTSNDKNSECTPTSPSALSASIDVAYANDAMDMTSSIMSNPDILLPAAGAAAVAAIGAAVGLRSSGNEDSASNAIEKEVPKIDVSIEYDAPAKLAFSELAKGGDADYAKFKELYESLAVSEVRKKVYEKKVAREMEQMDTEIADMRKEIDGMFN